MTHALICNVLPEACFFKSRIDNVRSSAVCPLRTHREDGGAQEGHLVRGDQNVSHEIPERSRRRGGGGRGRGNNHFMHGRNPYENRPSHTHNAGMEHVGVSPSRQTSRASSAKLCETFGESQEG